MAETKLLGICGALRAGSTNRKLLLEAARLFGPCDYSEGDIRLPLYDGDIEAADGVPESVAALSAKIAAADAVLISTPEYNKGPTGALKNALDWVSRTSDKPWADKPVAVMSAAAGMSGGVRAQLILRTYMMPFNPRLIMAPEVHLGGSGQAFDDAGCLKLEGVAKGLETLMQNLAHEIARAR